MFSGLKRSLLLIAAMLTIVPWGIMQAVQKAQVPGARGTPLADDPEDWGNQDAQRRRMI
jgi:hypothetical protein